MLELAEEAEGDPHLRSAPIASPDFYRRARVLVTGALARNTKLILVMCALGALAGAAASKLLTPSYIAASQIYVDPRGLPGTDKDSATAGQDSNGFINYVETLSLIMTSRSVLERVVKSEKLNLDDEFTGGGGLAPLFGSTSSVGDATDAAVRTLATRISVHRPERTSIIDLSVKSRDPQKAARLANAVAQAFIDVQSAMQSDSAHKATVSLDGRLQSLRAAVMTAEKKIEDYKAQNGLVSTHDQLVSEQQLAEVNQQLTLARVREQQARSRYDLIQAARRRGGDIGSIAVDLNLATIAPLRAQQGEARQKLADLLAELGPRHPLIRDAEARVSEAKRAVDEELARVAEAGRSDYLKSQQDVATLSKQLEDLQTQNLAGRQASVELRDLERTADAARNVYELFVTRSRQTGDIQQVDADAPSVKIISAASEPNRRAFPPGLSVMASGGLLLGFALGVLLAAWQERSVKVEAIGKEPAAPLLPSVAAREEPNFEETPTSAVRSPQRRRGAPADQPPFFVVSVRSGLGRPQHRRPLEELDLLQLDLPMLQETSEEPELDRVFAAFENDRRRGKRGANLRRIAVIGENSSGLRSALAVKLALRAHVDGARVALFDASTSSDRLTRAVRRGTNTAIPAEPFIETVNGVQLSLPKCFDSPFGRVTASRMDRYLQEAMDAKIDVLIFDGPDKRQDAAQRMLEAVDDIILLDTSSLPFDDEARLAWLGPALGKVRAVVSFASVSDLRVMVS